MYIRFLRLKNWRNFKDAEINLAPISYILGPNASGKSNLMDVLRFLRDVCKPEGGGLQKAIKDRGGISKLRCLHARRDPEVSIEVHLSDSWNDAEPVWKYILGFKPEGKGAQRILVSREQVWHDGELVLDRPDKDDANDLQLLTETHLEQIRANREFRAIAEHVAETSYLHLVPQLLKYSDKIGGNRLTDDPFGQGFLERIAKCTAKTRDARLKRISRVLNKAVPQFDDLRFSQDELGHPHLEALYEHHRPNAGWQREEHFSDGTLRLLGILWSLIDGKGLLLIEEPELSLHSAVVQQIPLHIDRIQRNSRVKRQIIITTHSDVMLGNTGIDPEGVVVLESSKEGTTIRPVSDAENMGLSEGLSVADVVLPQTRPQGIDQMALWE